MVLGDMNARNTNWGNPDTKGHRIEKVIKYH